MNKTANTDIVRARIPADIKKQTISVLKKMGLTPSDLIRLTFIRVAEEGRLPFPIEVPNRTTLAAVDELEAGKGKRHDNAEALFKDLGI